MSVDPLTEKYNFQSPYVYADNNPIFFVDINGMGIDEQDWKPTIDSNGDVTYVSEKGDSANTLAAQYSNVNKKEAEKITGTKGDKKIKEGTRISGKKVKKIIKNEILKLDLSSTQADDEHVASQVGFASNYTKNREKIGFFTTDFFGKVFEQENRVKIINFQKDDRQARLILPLYEAKGTFLNVRAYPYFLSVNTITEKTTYGTMFLNTNKIKQFQYPLYLTFGKKATLENLKFQGNYTLYISGKKK